MRSDEAEKTLGHAIQMWSRVWESEAIKEKDESGDPSLCCAKEVWG